MLWDRKRNVDILEETADLPVEEQLHHKRMQWFRCLKRTWKQVLLPKWNEAEDCRDHNCSNG